MLKLTIEPGDKVLIGKGEEAIVVSFERRTNAGAVLVFNAPREVPIYTVFADPEKQFKNRRK